MVDTSPVRDFFSSDLHMFHDQIIGFSGRPFPSLKLMQDRIIEDHNSVVTNKDRWWCIGDFSFGDPQENIKLLKRMNGQKFLIRGNHDHKRRTNGITQWTKIESRIELKIDTGLITDNIVMDHFPLLSWHKMHYGSYMLHGHCHGNLRLPEPWASARIFDVGIDNRYKIKGDFRPWEWRELREHLKDRTLMHVDHHAPKVDLTP